jgi:hypothetical protein
MKNNQKSPEHRPSRLPDGAPLDYAPDNEQGVVFLFSHLARKKFGMRVERIQTGFPDCIAYRGTKRIRIEFEYRSRNFRDHRHLVSGCDLIVCWEHNWPDMPRKLQVIELRQKFGLGFNAWFQPVSIIDGENYADKLGMRKLWNPWSVPSQAMAGDLLLYYRTAKCLDPKSCVREIFRVVSPVEHVKKVHYKAGSAYMADIRLVCKLNAPLHLSEMRANTILCSAGFIRAQMQGSPRATEYWPELYRMIVSRNPSIERVLRKYGPDRVT